VFFENSTACSKVSAMFVLSLAHGFRVVGGIPLVMTGSLFGGWFLLGFSLVSLLASFLGVGWL